MKCTLVIHYQSLSFKTDVETSSVEIQRYQFFCTFQDSECRALKGCITEPPYITGDKLVVSCALSEKFYGK